MLVSDMADLLNIDVEPLAVFFYYYYNSGKNISVAIPPLIVATLISLAIHLYSLIGAFIFLGDISINLASSSHTNTLL